jgi:hypothetical protein
MNEHSIFDSFSVEATSEGTGAPHPAGEAIRAAESARMLCSLMATVDHGHWHQLISRVFIG